MIGCASHLLYLTVFSSCYSNPKEPRHMMYQRSATASNSGRGMMLMLISSVICVKWNAKVGTAHFGGHVIQIVDFVNVMQASLEIPVNLAGRAQKCLNTMSSTDSMSVDTKRLGLSCTLTTSR